MSKICFLNILQLQNEFRYTILRTSSTTKELKIYVLSNVDNEQNINKIIHILQSKFDRDS